jgi:AraC-like DNA-binding protein
MGKNSGALSADGAEIVSPAQPGLERSCAGAVKPDGIVKAPSAGTIERIEARFHGNGFAPHRHDTYAIGITLSGVQTFRYRGIERSSLPGNVIVLHPDELHDGAAGTEDGLTYRMLYLPPESLADAGASRLPFVPDPVVADDGFRLCLAEALEDLATEPDPLMLDDLVLRLTGALQRHSDDRGKPAEGSTGGSVDRAAMLRCRDYLREHSALPVSSAALEAVSGVDRHQTARQFRRLFGTSPHRYLVMRRLDRAKAEMADGSSIAAAALDAGFADQAHFTRHFKKTFGMTPGRWLALSRPA